MRRTTPSTYAVGLALTAVVAVAGCTGPAPTQTVTSSSTSTGSSTTSKPTTSSAAPTTPETSATTTTVIDPNIPAAAKTHTREGAEVFVRYFFDQFNLAWTLPKSPVLPGLYGFL